MPLHYYFHQQQTIHRKQLETCVGIVSNVGIIKLSKIMWLTQKRRPPMAPRVLKLTKTHNLLGLKSSKRWSINDRNTYLMKHFETNSQRFNYTYIYNIYILSHMPANWLYHVISLCLVCKLTIFLIFVRLIRSGLLELAASSSQEPGDVPLLGEIATKNLPRVPLASSIKHSHGTSQFIDSSSNSSNSL